MGQDAPEKLSVVKLGNKFVLETRGNRMQTINNLELLLRKLTDMGRETHQLTEFINVIMSSAVLYDTGCEVLCHLTRCEIAKNEKVIL